MLIGAYEKNCVCWKLAERYGDILAARGWKRIENVLGLDRILA